MNRKALVLLILLLLGVGILFMMPSGQKGPAKAAKGLAAPDFMLQDLDGKTWKLSDLKGKVVLLHFWATWCDTCKEENPTLMNLIRLEKDNPGFVVLTVLYRDTPENAARYRTSTGFTPPVLIDTTGAASSYGLTGVPESFIIDTKGVLREKIIGPMQWDTPQARQRLSAIAQGA
jgi:peroxiredoxin